MATRSMNAGFFRFHRANEAIRERPVRRVARFLVFEERPLEHPARVSQVEAWHAFGHLTV
ncbi:MAG: hypothetical protein Q6373_012485 [Candidatus Sigynarchaeota archaeon]